VRRWLDTYLFTSKLHILDTSVFTTITDRRSLYNSLLNANYRPDVHTGDHTWATDGSHKNVVDKFTSTTAAIVGPATAAFKLTGQYGSSLHAERLGLIAGFLNARKHSGESTILTDHLNSVRDIERIRSPYYEHDGWKPRPEHELYRWMLAAAKSSTARVLHIKAHTDAADPQSILNDNADKEATIAHHSSRTTIIPALTGWMRPWAPYIMGTGIRTGQLEGSP